MLHSTKVHTTRPTREPRWVRHERDPMDPSMMKQMALGTLPPGFVGLAVLALWSWSGRNGKGAGVRAIGAAMFGIAFVPIAALVSHGLAFPPKSASQWMPWLGVIAGAGAFAATRCPSSRWIVWGSRVLVTATIGWLSVQSQARGAWGAGQTAATLVIFAALTLGVLGAIDGSLGGRERPRSTLVPSLVATTVLGGTAMVLVLAFFSLSLAQTAGITAALVGGVVVGSLWKRGVAACPGQLDAPAVLGMAMLLHGFLFGESESPLVHVGLTVASPLASLAARRAVPLSWQGWKRGVIEVAAAAAPMAAAVGLALAQRPHE